MATFEVTIDSADARTLRLLVAAEHWVEAWQEGLVLIGDDPAPTDANCVLDDLTAHIEVPSTGRSFIVRPLPRATRHGPTPERGNPIVMSGDATQSPAITVRQKRPGPPPEAFDPTRSALPDTHATGRPADPAHLARSPVSGLAAASRRDEPASADADPVARVLSDLERQRISARPIRLDSRGMPQRFEPTPNRRRATPLAVPRSTGPDDERAAAERRTRNETLAFTPAAAGPIDALPQLFFPVSASGGTDPQIPTARLAALQWAVDTAWQHVPCALALLLDGLDTELPKVAFARGERERETRGCRVPLVHAFRQAACVAPTRVRFAGDARIRFVRADDQVQDLRVQSTLCAPIAFVPGHPSPATAGLGLVLIDSTRGLGFIDSELRALTYLARTLAARLDGL